jgi:acyl transferase domain-containing protein/thioesterase domain-containing protein/acyl carrier protein
MSDEWHGQEVAIIGAAGRFPGARNLERFWENLCQGVESITFFTRAELRENGVLEDLLNHPRYVPAAGALPDYDRFDASFFGYSNAEAQRLDPQIRLAHECVYRALAQAGYPPPTCEQPTGLFLGLSANLAWEAACAMSTERNPAALFEAEKLWDKDFAATRIAYCLDLRGPAVSVSTACSSALLAVHLACQALLGGDCTLAVAGGTSVAVPHRVGYLHQPSAVTSPDGHCRPFDISAAGTVRGSGGGAVVLKLLEDALRDRDSILAVICGSAANNDGRAKAGFTAPSPQGQALVIRAAQQAAATPPESIGYLEAHGTGTALGDPVEIEGLKKAFDTEKRGFCRLGSVKSNIGHLDAAAGIASLLKTALSLHHRSLPATLNVTQPNPALHLEHSPFVLNTETMAWPPADHPRRAGVSSFGIGGTNVHLVLQEAPRVSQEKRKPSTDSSHGSVWPQVICLSAKTATACETLTERWCAHLSANPDISIADLAYTAWVGRPPRVHRRAVVAETTTKTLHALRSGAIAGTADRAEASLIFAFPGQGAQHPQMGKTLYETFPGFRRDLDQCFALVAEKTAQAAKNVSAAPCSAIDLKALMYPPDAAPDEKTALGQTLYAQLALFTFQYALARLLTRFGLRPNALLGHSIGEYTCACLAGVFSLAEAIELIVLRGRLMQQMAPGAMLALGTDTKTVARMLGENVFVAAENGPQRVVVSGTVEAIERLAETCRRKSIPTTRLHTSHAFHCPRVVAASRRFAEILKGRRYGCPQIPFVSNVTGDWITETQAADPVYWAEQMHRPVRFMQGVRTIVTRAQPVFVEVGPGRTLCTLIRQIAAQESEPEDIFVQNTLPHPKKDVSEPHFFTRTLACLWTRGLPIDLGPLLAKTAPGRRLHLPTHPFARTRFWAVGEKLQHGLDSLFAARFSEEASPDGGGVQTDAPQNLFYTPTWQRSARLDIRLTTDTLRRTQAETCWLYLSAQTAFDARLIEAARSASIQVIRVCEGSRFRRLADDEFALRPGVEKDFARLQEDLQKQSIAPNRILHTWCLAGSSPDLSTRVDRALRSIVFAAQTVGTLNAPSTAPFETPLLTVVTQNTLSVTTKRDDWGASGAIMALGPVLSLGQENDDLHLHLIDLERTDRAGPAHLAACLARSAADTGALEKITAVRGHYLWNRRYLAAPVKGETAPKKSGLRDDGVYLILGGTGTLGLTFAEAILEHCRAAVCLVSRSAKPLGKRTAHPKRLTALTAHQRVLHRRADITDGNQLEIIVAEMCERFGNIRGVVHAVGALWPLPASEIDRTPQIRNRIDTFIQQRALGIETVNRVLTAQPLDFCILSASLATVLGGFGYSVYTAAHLYANQTASKIAPSQSTDWRIVYWDKWNRTAQTDPRAFDRQTGKQAFLQALALLQHHRQLMIARTALAPRIAKWVEGKANQAGRSSRVPPPATAATDLAIAPRPRPDLAQRYVPPRTPLESRLVEAWQRFFALERVGIDDDFFALGGDSLKAISLLARLERMLGVPLSTQRLLNEPTVRGLSVAAESAVLHPKTGDDYVVFNDSAKGTLFCFPPYVCFALSYYALSQHLTDAQMICFNFRPTTNPIVHFADLIEGHFVQAPYVLFGYSAGGRVAFAVARELERRGQPVSNLILLEAFAQWKDISQFAPAIENRRARKLLNEHAAHLLDDDALMEAAVGRLLAYSRLVHCIEVSRPIHADIDHIASTGQPPTAENADWVHFVDGNTWKPHTQNKYRAHQGYGNHMDMLLSPHLEKNAALLKRIFSTIEIR